MRVGEMRLTLHVIGVPRFSLFFATLPLPCIILNATEEQKWGLGTRLPEKMWNKLQPKLPDPFPLLQNCVWPRETKVGQSCYMFGLTQTTIILFQVSAINLLKHQQKDTKTKIRKEM